MFASRELYRSSPRAKRLNKRPKMLKRHSHHRTHRNAASRSRTETSIFSGRSSRLCTSSVSRSGTSSWSTARSICDFTMSHCTQTANELSKYDSRISNRLLFKITVTPVGARDLPTPVYRASQKWSSQLTYPAEGSVRDHKCYGCS